MVAAGALLATSSKLSPLCAFSARFIGAKVRWRAARTLCSIWERRAEYMERFSTDLWRMTKSTATIPMMATAGPISRSIGADYRRSTQAAHSF